MHEHYKICYIHYTMTSDSINGYKQKSNVELDIETMELKKLARVRRFQIPFQSRIQSRFYNFPRVIWPLFITGSHVNRNKYL